MTATPVPSSPDAEALRRELGDLRSSRDLLELFLRDAREDAGVPEGLVRSAAAESDRAAARIGRLEALLAAVPGAEAG